MGVVIEHEFEVDDCGDTITEFLVLWSDNDRCEYDYDDLYREYIKVVKF